MGNGEKGALEFIRKTLGEESEILKKFENFVASSESVDLESLFDEIDQSDYSLLDWVEALVDFDAWLTQKEVKERPFQEMLGYVHCCTMATAQTISSPRLKVIVYQSLTDFGFDAAPEPQL